MLRSFRLTSMTAVLAAALGFVGLLAPAAHGAPMAQDSGTSRPSLSVSGEGDARAEPDLAVVTVGAAAIAPSAEAAMADVNRRVAGVIDAVRSVGIAERDIQTSGIALQPIQRPRPGPDQAPPEIEGYRASNSVVVTVRIVSRAGLVLDAAMANGANQVGGLRFALSDPEEARARALDKAVRNARAQAEVMAQAAGVRIEGVISMSDEGGAPRPIPAAGVVELRAAEAPTPVQPGELTVHARVRVTYAIS